MKVKITSLLVVCMFLMFSFSSCGLHKGYVYDKKYTAAWTQIIPARNTETCEKEGNEEICEPYLQPPSVIAHPASWELYISNCQSPKEDSNCETASITVSESRYNDTSIGQHVDEGDS